MSSIYLFGVIFLAVLVMIIAISKFNLHPFIVLVVISIAVGLACGLDTVTVINTVKSGFGNILASIGIVILCGTIIGTILEKTGAALTMANTILKIVGKKRSVVTMGAMGYVTGIPVFCDSGFVVLSPISRALAAQSNTSLAVMATALSGGLYATHCLVPPTPGPIAMAGTLEADLGLTILVGLLISIPAVAVVILYATKISSKIDIPANPEYTIEELTEKYGKLPGALHSFSPILLPIVLIGLSSIASLPSLPFGEGAVYAFLNFIGNPVVALLLGVFLSMTLIPKSEQKNTLEWVTKGVTDSAAIIAITGAGGSFGEILKLLPIADATTGLLATGLGVLVPFVIAMILKLAMGASTVAMITTAGMVAPMLTNMGLTSPLGRVLVVMAIGAGSMVASHANDSYFWVVSQFSDMKTSEAYRCQTGMTAVMGITVIIIVYILSLFVV
ncbi:GntP family permease [Subdoligranulum variabile]|uniref:Transporter, gluconate:H+ symporter family n=1 Tax=Subdoligranulum variabile DSM 15176 TaxID=411471 RepID=D1PIN5_9FIRM|nr:GntP family permease [Subdoligranulum variabile]EFB77394.1 transporter, gluconate:H+ symporter family [Subdoligranulum variabile DSM 15176]UWP67286.1 GntP family permease [Subdoligranulum variabile]